MKKTLCGTVMVILAASQLLPAQAPPAADPASADLSSNAPAPTEPATAEEIQSLSLEELLAAARTGIERAEARGPDAQQAVNEVARLTAAALAKNPNSIEARYYQARMMLLVNRVFEALPILKEWAASPAGASDYKVYQILGDLYRDTYPSLAVPQYDAAINLNESDVRSYVGKSKALVKLGRKDEAVQVAEQAVSKDVTDNPTVRGQLVDTLIAAERLTEAEKEAVRVVQRAQSIAQSSRGNPKPLEDLDEHMNVLIAILESRLAQASGQADDYMGLAQLKLDQSSVRLQLAYYAALADLESGLVALGDTAPDNLRAERARLLVAVGRIDDAVQQLEQILSTNPEQPTAREIMQQIQAATQKQPAAAPPS